MKNIWSDWGWDMVLNADGQLLGNIGSKLRCLLSEEPDNFLALVSKFTVWTVSNKSQDDRFRHMCFNMFSEYSTSSTSGF